MTKKNIAFIEPSADKSNVFENYMRLPLMGTLYLGTILHNAGHRVRIYNENVMRGHIDPFDIEADIYCLSALTVSANRARLLAHEIRRINPDARVIVGGIHASLLPKDFEDVANQVVYGEAEGIIVDLIEGRITDKFVSGFPLENLDDLPLVNYGLLEGALTGDAVPVMTSRGCPFDCNFCTVTKIFGKRFRMQSPERIMAELKNVREQLGKRSIFFYDDNFVANRKRVRKFCELVKKENLVFNWAAQVRSDLAKDGELVAQMADAGCRRFYIGFESINDAALKAMHKAQTRADIEHAIRTFQDNGIKIHGMFIFGEDNDTSQSFKATVDFAVDMRIDTLQFMILTPFPGTRIYENLVKQNRIIHTRWDYYDGMYAVFRPRNMLAARLQEETLKAYKRFYSLRRVALEGLRLMFDIWVDAFTWNFSRVFHYSFQSVFLKTGARFIVSRYAKTFQPYVEFLKRIEEKQVLKRLADE